MLEATALACERGSLSLFAGVDFALPGSGLARVRGANGSGKTSLLRILAGLTRPSAGSVRWRGRPIGEVGEEYGRDMLFIGHASGVKDELTVAENLAFAARLSGLDPTHAALRNALEQLGMDGRAHLPARFLSQGQRRRVALARLAIAASVPLWILDEPFAALDAQAIVQVSGLADAHLAAGGLLVLTSHQDVELRAGIPVAIGLGT